jgi:hypothetical protein
VLYEEGFEQDAGGWNPADGMAAERVTGEAHTGDGALGLEGTQAFGWNYASKRLSAAVIPGSRVRLEAWMRVDRLSPQDHPPYLKVAVNRADGTWIENYNTNGYDMSKPGTWEKLEVAPDLAADAASADIAVEKGAEGLSVTGRILIDDVRLVMTERP